MFEINKKKLNLLPYCIITGKEDNNFSIKSGNLRIMFGHEVDNMLGSS